NAYDYDAAAEAYSNAGTLSAVNQKPTKASDDQGGYPPEHSVFWQGGTDKAEQQQSVSSSASELNWIEIRLVDEHNQPFNSVPGVLKDSAGKCFPVKASQGNILLCNIAQGAVELQFDNPAWLQDSEARKPYQGEQDPVCVWIEENVVGYKATPRQLLNATAGDFVVLQPEQVLPERHQAGKADMINLESGNSYLIKVRGFNYITLRVGMFFDGTGNNTFSAQWGKQQFERYIGEWKQRFEQGKNEIAKKAGISPSEVKIKDLPGNCFSYPNDRFYWFWQDDESVDGSATNELTNIQKLYDLYSSFFREKTLLQDQNLYVHREYVTGIGTGNETNLAPADESIFPGQALGTGDYGVVAKVSTGIEQLCDHISQLSVDIEPYTFDGIGCIEFDVFGFSRGAAAARHFVNVMAEGSRGELAQNLEKAMVSQGIVLSSSFAWDESRNCCANFVGLFDTVAAIVDFGRADFTPHNNDNGDVRLWLDPAKVKSAVHLTAHPTTEYRYNFCLNKLNPAGHFLEVVLPGAHSDLGGGYHATGYYDDPEYLLPRLESKCIAKVQRPHNDNVYSYERTREYLSKRLDVELAKEVSLGWEASNYTKEFVSRGAGNRPVLIGKLYKKRVVEGELSRLYLRLMFGLALNKGVLFHSNAIPDINDVNNKNFNVSEKIGDIEFKKKADSVLEQALQGCVDPSLMNQDMLIKLQKSNLIHHSSDNGIANKPNEHKQSGRYVRQVFECKE
ncbi:DUF2235 domain-containing protein, partial [Vibrio sp. V38_P2S17PM301]